jgi:hypothetical protein
MRWGLTSGVLSSTEPIPITTFAPTAIFWVPGWDIVNAIITEAVLPRMLGPCYANHDHRIEVRVTCCICWLLSKYAAMALLLGPMAPMNFLLSVGLAMVNDTTRDIQNLLARCLLWMHIAGTWAALGQPSALLDEHCLYIITAWHL